MIGFESKLNIHEVVKMKLLTLNIASGIGYDPEVQLRELTQALSDGHYDMVALQQVNQPVSGQDIPLEELDSYIPCQDRVPIKHGNFCFELVKSLQASGQIWYWSWLPAHLGYERFDEGLAILTPHPIRKTQAFYLSDSTDYTNFKTRMALGVQSAFTGNLEWFYNVQFGWWDDDTEPFRPQWDRFMKKIGGLDTPLYVMGSFDAPTDVKGQAYDYLLENPEFLDTFDLAEYKDDGITLEGSEAAWINPHERGEMRADLILTNQDEAVLDSHTLFKGESYRRISNHFGLSCEFKQEKDTVKNGRKSDIPEFSSEKATPMPLSVITMSGPLVLRTRKVRMLPVDPFEYLFENHKAIERARDIIETIVFDDDED